MTTKNSRELYEMLVNAVSGYFYERWYRHEM